MRAADSVALFTALAKPALLPNRIEWGAAKATGPSSLVLSDVVVTLAPNPAWPQGVPVRIARVTIEDIDFEGLRRGDAPLRLRLTLNGISASGRPAFLAALGPGPYRGSAALDYRVRAGEGLRVDRFLLDLSGLGRLELALDLGGAAALSGRLNAGSLDTVTMRSGRLVYEDRSLLAKAVAAEARRQNVKEKTVVTQWSLWLGLFAMREGSEALPSLNALLAFLQDYRSPHGALKISFNAPPDAPGGLPIADVLSAGILRTLGAKVSYAGAN
ncbi:MAG TPA: hypothetical protein VL244_09090 [Alphaproteobacteria bacterium]|nr:hypothetical protein [Alphaproteobacteria bacterium]